MRKLRATWYLPVPKMLRTCKYQKQNTKPALTWFAASGSASDKSPLGGIPFLKNLGGGEKKQTKGDPKWTLQSGDTEADLDLRWTTSKAERPKA